MVKGKDLQETTGLKWKRKCAGHPTKAGFRFLTIEKVLSYLDLMAFLLPHM